MKGAAGKGMQKATWDLRHSDLRVLSNTAANMPGFIVRPGTYAAEITIIENAKVLFTSNQVSFEVKEIVPNTIQTMDAKQAAQATLDIQKTSQSIDLLSINFKGLEKRIAALSKAAYAPKVPFEMIGKTKELSLKWDGISRLMYGDKLKDAYEKERTEGLTELMSGAGWAMYATTTGATGTHLKQLKLAQEQLAALQGKVDDLTVLVQAAEQEIKDLGIAVED